MLKRCGAERHSVSEIRWHVNNDNITAKPVICDVVHMHVLSSDYGNILGNQYTSENKPWLK